MYLGFVTYFGAREDVTRRVQQVNLARFHYSASLASWVYYWGRAPAIQAIKFTEEMRTIWGDSDELAGQTDEFFVMELPNGTKYYQIDIMPISFNEMARIEYMTLMDMMAELVESGENIEQYGSSLYRKSTWLEFCTNMEQDWAYPLEPWQGNLQTTWSYELMMESMFLEQPDLEKWWTNNSALCVVVKSLTNLSMPLEEVQSSLASMAVLAADRGQALLVPLRFALPFGLLFFQIIWWSLASWRYVRELNRFADMLLGLPKEVKRETLRPVRKDAKIEEESVSSQAMTALPGYSLPGIFNVIVIFLFVGVAGLQLGQTFNLESFNKQFSYLNTWTVLSRKCHVMEGAVAAWLDILYYNPFVTGGDPARQYLDLDPMLQMTQHALTSLDLSMTHILEDDGVTPISVGIDSVIDDLTLQSLCEAEHNNTSFHDLYRCASVLQLIGLYTDVVNDVLVGTKGFNGSIRDGNVPDLIHILDHHLIPALVRIDDRYGLLNGKMRSDFQTTHILFFVFELVLNVVIAFVSVMFVYTLHKCYEMLLSIMRRVSPVHILASEDLEAYLLGIGMSVHERIINTSRDCTIFMGANGVIEMINPAVSQTFGFTRERLLSLPFVTLMTPEHSEKITQQIKMMASRQSSPVYEGHVVCRTDDETEIPCGISILAIFVDNELSSFVGMLKNESALAKQQNEAEIAKKQSEDLLYQILPRSIVVRMNAGEKDISFQVPSSTIMFIDIVKFSEYAANLTPQEIMGNLALIFAGFDEACAKYPLLLKIKLIGDVYMCAGGLFNAEKPPMAHAEEMIKFALDALQVIEEANMKLNALLSVRIGVNTGGPLLAGVLGTDKPTFDIIADPINIAARLQSTDVPGCIQISEATQELVAGSGVPDRVARRSVLERKGKTEDISHSATQGDGGVHDNITNGSAGHRKTLICVNFRLPDAP
jgi:PAS domain S-box-containing protein